MLKNYFFAGILKVKDENRRIRIQIHPQNVMDPQHWKKDFFMFLISTTCCQSAKDIRDLQCLKLEGNHTEIDKDKFSLSKIFENTKFFAHMHLKFTLCKNF